MKFTVQIDCDNAAFEGDDLFSEVRAILGEVANQVGDKGHRDGGTLRDANGNRVGRWDFIA